MNDVGGGDAVFWTLWDTQRRGGDTCSLRQKMQAEHVKLCVCLATRKRISFLHFLPLPLKQCPQAESRYINIQMVFAYTLLWVDNGQYPALWNLSDSLLSSPLSPECNSLIFQSWGGGWGPRPMLLAFGYLLPIFSHSSSEKAMWNSLKLCLKIIVWRSN